MEQIFIKSRLIGSISYNMLHKYERSNGKYAALINCTSLFPRLTNKNIFNNKI